MCHLYLLFHFCSIVWDMAKFGYKKNPLKEAKWEEAGKLCGVTAEHVHGWFRSQRDVYNGLVKVKSGQAARDPATYTDRQKWVVQNFKFYGDAAFHRPRPIFRVSTHFVVRQIIFLCFIWCHSLSSQHNIIVASMQK